MDSGTTKREPAFDFVGGHLCLDFSNTVGGLPLASLSQERLTRYLDLVCWSQQANLISKSEAQVLLSLAESAEVEAAAVLERAHALREAIYGVFAAIALGRQPVEGDLETLNREVEQAMAGGRVRATTDGFSWQWRKREGSLDQMLGPVARSAATLLTSVERTLVRQCANEDCRWLFVDATKNHRRQWCMTTACGNRARVRKYRERQRSKENPANDL